MRGKKSKGQVGSARPRRPEQTAATAECRALFSSLSPIFDAPLQQKICAGVTRHIGDCTPCQEFLFSLRDTVGRIAKQSSGKLSPADAAQIRQVILEQYRSVTTAIARARSAGR